MISGRVKGGRLGLALGGVSVVHEGRDRHRRGDKADSRGQAQTHETTNPHAHVRILPGNCGLSRLTPSPGSH